MRIPPQQVLVHWASAKIKHADDRVDDRTLGQQIISKLEKYADIPYSDIASTAYGEGRKVLATMVSCCVVLLIHT